MFYKLNNISMTAFQQFTKIISFFEVDTCHIINVLWLLTVPLLTQFKCLKCVIITTGSMTNPIKTP